MALTVVHPKTNTITDWTQPQLDAQIALGNFPPGTLLADIVLPSDWNADHTLTGSVAWSEVTDKFKATVEVDFGFLSGQENNIVTVTVPATWVTPTTALICAPLATATADHDPEDYALEGIKAYATNIVDGVSFDIIVSANYATFGKYNIQAIGV